VYVLKIAGFTKEKGVLPSFEEEKSSFKSEPLKLKFGTVVGFFVEKKSIVLYKTHNFNYYVFNLKFQSIKILRKITVQPVINI